jgi:hypothetical protein
MSITTGVYLTRGPSGPNPGQVGPRGGRPWFESAQPGIWLTHLYIGSQGSIQGLKAVEAERSGRPETWMISRPSISSKPSPLPRYKPPMAKDSTTYSACSSPLVKVQFSSSSCADEAPSGVESRVEHSLELRK